MQTNNQTNNQTKNAHFWICLRNFLEKLAFLCRENLWKVIGGCHISKNSALPQVFFCHILRKAAKDFQSFSKYFPSISTSHTGPFKFMHALYNKWKIQIFDPIVRGNADNASGRQMMSYSNVEKDLNRNKHLNLNLINTAACLYQKSSPSPKTN